MLCPASAIIKIDFPVSRVYQEAAVVVAGEVTRAGNGPDVACAVNERLKGQLPQQTLTITLKEGLSWQVKAADPVVAFIREERAILHLADAWYEAERRGGSHWAISAPSRMVKNYPGRTEGLVAIVRQIKAGKPSIKDAIGHEFVGSLRDWGNLGVRPTFLVATDIDADGETDLLVGASDGVRLFQAESANYTDVTEPRGLKGTLCKRGAAGDVNGDGQPDLLLGKALWLCENGRFVKARDLPTLPEEDAWTAAALADADGDSRADVVVLDRNGNLVTAINPNNGSADWTVKSTNLWTAGDTALAAAFSKDWGDDGALYALVVHPEDIVRYPVGSAKDPKSDFRRLTGLGLAEYPKIGSMPMRVDLCTAFDYDGNGKADFLLLTQSGGITLANRGYGAMLINGFMHTQLRPPPGAKKWPKIPQLSFEVSPSVFVVPGKKAGRTGKGNAQNVLLLRGDGQLFELINAR
jgi:hypothetical protein